jgi:3'-5' exoribonuclease
MFFYGIITTENAADFLTEYGHKYLTVSVFNATHEHVIMDDAFNEAPGGSSHHHNYRHGLRQHTAEVLQHAINIMGGELPLRINVGSTVDMSVVVAAAIWHDYAKVHEYRLKEKRVWSDIPKPDAEEGDEPVAVFAHMNPETLITKLPYMQLIGHPVGSAMEFQKAMHGVQVPSEDWVNRVVHCILSHHGRREWGAPVEPATPEAWVLHSADMLSSHPLFQS